MRVLLISHTCQSRTEGQPKAEWLGRMPGVELRVLTPKAWKHYGAWRAPDVPEPVATFALEARRVVFPWLGPAQYYLHWYPGLASLLREFRPHVIDLWEEPWGLVSAQACWARDRLLPRAKVVSETEQNIEKVLPFPFERLRSYTLGRADFAVGRSREAVGVLRAKGYRGPAEVVPNAVDAELFRPLDRGACRRDLQVGGFVAGYVGRLVEEKGLADLVDAVALCPEQVKLLVVGAGPFREELERRAGDRGLTGRVRFLAAMPAGELPRVMNALDVLVLPSRTTPSWKEQFGRVIIEAQACGVPVIGSNSGAIADVVGRGGLVVPERDPAALAAALRALAADPVRAREMGAAGRGQVEESYTWERVARRMWHIYQDVTAAAGTGALAEPCAAGRE